MHNKWLRASLVSFVMIMSSLAGCVGTEDEELKEGQYGTVMVSTYHIAELVSAIAGDSVKIEMISTDNVPAHDLDPGTPDLVRLGDSDLFLYHGLGLEPWVDEKIAELGDNAPKHHMVHAMPTGEIDLDYEIILGNQLCRLLSNPSAEVMTMLDIHVEDSGNIRGEDSVYNFEFPKDEHDEHDHDEEDHEEDEHEHDEHEDEAHDNHGHEDEHAHGEHSMVEAEEELTEGLDTCPTDVVASIYHFEEGEYILEFGAEEVESFKMAIAKMGGAHNHAHDDHKEDDEHDEHEEREEHEHEMTAEEAMLEVDTNNDGKMSWEEFEFMMMSDFEEEHDHDDAHDNETHEEDDDHGEESHEDDEAEVRTRTYDNCIDEEDALSSYICWNDEWDEDSDGTPEDSNSYWNYECQQLADGTWECTTDHINYYDHCAYEDDHYYECWLDEWDTDSDGAYDLGSDGYMDDQCESLEDGRWACGHAEDDHDPIEEAFEEYMMKMYMGMFNASDEDGDSLLDLEELGHFIEAIEDMEEMQEDIPMEVIMIAFDEDGDEKLSFDEYLHFMEMGEDEHDEDHGEHDHDGEHDDEHENETHEEDHEHNHDDGDDHGDEEDMFMEMFQMMFNMSDANGDGYLDSTELEVMMEEMMEEEHEEGVAYIHLHIEEEGEYGIALPDHVELHILSEGEHEGHDHGEHDHEDEESHEEEDEEHRDGHEEELAYDPHSWLDPVAYSAQVDVVLGHLIDTFPEGEDQFRSNANTFKEQLVKLDEQYESLAENCQNRSVVANHNAYSYMAYRYDIQFITVHGLDPEGEPTPEDLAEVIEHIEEEGITVLFIEEYTDESSVNSIVEATGVTVKTLYTMEMAPMNSDDDYLSLMQKNVENLKSGMSCSA